MRKIVWSKLTVRRRFFILSIIDLNQYLRLVYKCRGPLLVLSAFWFFCANGCADYTVQVCLHLCVGRRVLPGEREKKEHAGIL